MQNIQQYALCAMLSRMKYITRWGLMRTCRSETLSEHTAETSIIAHILALITLQLEPNAGISAERVAVAALYHDASEILTGDMPTPVKYKNEALKTAYKELERQSAERLSHFAPPFLQKELLCYLTGDVLNEQERTLLKAADKLSALIKCIEETLSGGTEFSGAKAQQLAALKGMSCPAADYFIAHILPCYEKNLDELSMMDTP